MDEQLASWTDKHYTVVKFIKNNNPFLPLWILVDTLAQNKVLSSVDEFHGQHYLLLRAGN